MADDKDFIDYHLDTILKASGSGLKNYSMHQTREGMRKALRAALAAATAPQQPAQDKPAAIPEGFALTLVDRSYDQRVAAIIAHNQCKGDLDDKLDAAYHASLAAAPAPDTGGA